MDRHIIVEKASAAQALSGDDMPDSGQWLLIVACETRNEAQRLSESLVAASLEPTTPEQAHASLWHEFGMLTLADVAGIADVPLTTPLEWAEQQRVLLVEAEGVDMFPGFQFDDYGQPYGVIREVMKALNTVMAALDIALWFVSTSSHLAGSRPVDLLETHPADVISAARALRQN